MRYGPNDELWVVVNPTSNSEMADILFKTTLIDLANQFRGGLSIEDHNPTLFTDREEAEADAMARFAAVRAVKTVSSQGADALRAARRIQVLDADGAVLFEAQLEVPRSTT